MSKEQGESASTTGMIYSVNQKSVSGGVNTRCSGPRQRGHPLIYESHCDHGETEPHIIKPAQAAGEWTEGKVFAYFESEDFKGLADAINAAIAAERESADRDVRVAQQATAHAQEDVRQLRAQLATVAWCEVHAPTIEESITCCPCCEAVHEREQFATAVEALEKIADGQAQVFPMQLRAIAANALAKIKEGKSCS